MKDINKYEVGLYLNIVIALILLVGGVMYLGEENKITLLFYGGLLFVNWLIATIFYVDLKIYYNNRGEAKNEIV